MRLRRARGARVVSGVWDGVVSAIGRRALPNYLGSAFTTGDAALAMSRLYDADDWPAAQGEGAWTLTGDDWKKEEAEKVLDSGWRREDGPIDLAAPRRWTPGGMKTPSRVYMVTVDQKVLEKILAAFRVQSEPGSAPEAGSTPEADDTSQAQEKKAARSRSTEDEAKLRNRIKTEAAAAPGLPSRGVSNAAQCNTRARVSGRSCRTASAPPWRGALRRSGPAAGPDR